VTSDQFETPEWVKEEIEKEVRVSRTAWLDQFEFNKTWSLKSCYDAFTAPWRKNFINFCNPPFSQAAAALYKAEVEFYQGVNSVLLVPQRCVN
jgi:hypothetical protein